MFLVKTKLYDVKYWFTKNYLFGASLTAGIGNIMKLHLMIIMVIMVMATQ